MEIVQNNGKRLYLQLAQSGGGGAVNSVFGRTGTITAQSGDYNYSQISGAPGPYVLPAATALIRGGIKVGSNFNLVGDVLNGLAPYVLPAATTLVRGGFRPGANLTMLGDVLNAATGSVVTCMIQASVAGILANGTDQTGSINAILANSNYSGIIFDYVAPSAVTISGTVAGQNKLLLFYPGNTITGGTINQACIAGLTYYQKILDSSTTLTSCFTAGNRWSAMWYGATGNGSTDDQPFLQKNSDMMVLNTKVARTLYIPTGNYKTNSPWFINNFSGGEYRQININVISEENIESANNSSNARILPTFNNTFAIGVQFMNGGFIKGLSIEGMFSTAISQIAFYLTNFDAISGGARNSQYSPYSGIVVDPFSGLSVIPPDGGYPGMTSFYKGSAVRTGSTDFHIYQCRVQGFTVDVMWGPNGYTQQQEDCGTHNCDFNYCNCAVSWGNTQSDHSMNEDTRAWYYIYNVFDNRTYGNGSVSVGGTIGRIVGTNIAGVVKNLFNINIGQKNLDVRDAYCENLYSVGILESVHAEIVMDTCHFNFAYLPIRPQFHGQFQNATIRGCLFKYFDDQYNKRCWFGNGHQTKFEGCYFDQPPYMINQYADYYTTTFSNCQCFDPLFNVCALGMANSSYKISNTNVFPCIYGQFKIQDFSGLDSSDHATGGEVLPDATVTYDYNCSTFNRFLRSFAVGVIINPDPTLNTASFTCAFPNQCLDNDYCLDAATGNVLGRITNISGSTITISEIPDNITNASYTIDLVYYLTTSRPFVGDTAVGSSTISNVVPVLNAPYLSVNDRIEHPDFPMGTYITSYIDGIHTATVSTNSGDTHVKQNFANGYPQQEVRGLREPGDGSYSTFRFAFLGGCKWTVIPNPVTGNSAGVPKEFYFNAGGTLGGTSLKANYAEVYKLFYNSGVAQIFDPPTNAYINI